MKKIIALLSIFAVVNFMPVSAFALRPQVRKQVSKVVQVTFYSKDRTRYVTASAVAIDKVRFLTAGHFCNSFATAIEEKRAEEKLNIRYINANGEFMSLEGAQVISFEFSPQQDLCVLERPRHGIVPAKISKQYSKVKVGDKVFAVGAPRGVLPVITAGFVSMAVTHDMDMPILNNKMLFSAGITGGNSGGPVFDVKGEIVGIAVMSHPEYHHMNFAITADGIWDFLGKNE